MYSFATINFFELLAALAGSFYLRKNYDKISYLLISFLWFTFFVEVIFGWLPYNIQIFDKLSFLKGTFFEKNSWVYNIVIIIKFIFYPFYFNSYIENPKTNKILSYSIVTFGVTSILNLILSDVYFKMVSSYTYISGSILIMTTVLVYFFEVLKSDIILNFKKTLPFYIAIGAIVFHLSVTPLFIYSKYYSFSTNPDFTNVYKIILTAANIFMYTCFTIGFIVCSRKNRSYS